MNKPFALIGLALVIGGIALLLYIAYNAFVAIATPNDVPIVKYALSHLGTGDKIIYGHAGSDNFELNVTESGRTLTVLFLGIVVLWIAVGIARAIIVAGSDLIRFGSRRMEAEPSATAQPVVRNAD
jgi:uncharacterized membrane protein YobD (UPF0266 family)